MSLVYYKTTPEGKKLKVTRTVEIKHVPLSNPTSRSNWDAYGQALYDKLDPVKGEEINLTLFPKTADAKKQAEVSDKPAPTKKLICKNCKADHLTIHCPHKNNIATTEESRGSAGPEKYTSPASRMSGGKYISPALRAAMGGVNGMGVPGMSIPGMQTRERDVSCTLRVSNLPETVTESVLRHNFSSIGRVTRCHAPVSKATGRPRGFAFIEFDSAEKAEMARVKFDGMVVENMIMHVEFAQPRD